MKIALIILAIISFLSCNVGSGEKPNTISVSSTLYPEVEQLFSKFTSDLPQQAIVFSFIKFGNGGVEGKIREKEGDLINILSIKNDLLEGYYCIYISQNGKESLLLSKKTNNIDCDKPIQVSDLLSINLEKVYKVNLNSGVTWKLYNNNFYENGQLVFKKDMDVFRSGNLKGLCIIQ